MQFEEDSELQLVASDDLQHQNRHRRNLQGLTFGVKGRRFFSLKLTANAPENRASETSLATHLFSGAIWRYYRFSIPQIYIYIYISFFPKISG